MAIPDAKNCKLVQGPSVRLQLQKIKNTNTGAEKPQLWQYQNDARLLRAVQAAIDEHELTTNTGAYFENLSTNILGLPRELRDSIYIQYLFSFCAPNTNQICHSSTTALIHSISETLPGIVQEVEEALHNHFLAHFQTWEKFRASDDFIKLHPDLRGSLLLERQYRRCASNKRSTKFSLDHSRFKTIYYIVHNFMVSLTDGTSKDKAFSMLWSFLDEKERGKADDWTVQRVTGERAAISITKGGTLFLKMRVYGRYCTCPAGSDRASCICEFDAAKGIIMQGRLCDLERVLANFCD